MDESPLMAAIADVPPGAWAVGVSGGADSVALLFLLAERRDLALHVVHLNHETRGPHSDGDERFLRDLAERLRLPCVIARRSEIEPTLGELPTNPSARYRAARMALFRLGVNERGLQGVILAHHADDQAETILHRLLRGSGPAGLAGMARDATIGGLRILRPLLAVRGQALRDLLTCRYESWREDASNATDDYLRNRLRRILARHAALVPALLELGDACRQLRSWETKRAPALPTPQFTAETLSSLPEGLALEAARRWLVNAGSRPEDLTPPVLNRLVEMARDMATPAKQQFPGGLTVRRRGGMVFVEAAIHSVPSPGTGGEG